jgi:anti-sigma factor RsiW
MTDDLHALSGAYALDAIDDVEEQRRFESHLAGCETCATELREFRATTARLGMAAAEPPPPALRDRVLADIRHVQQLPPPRREPRPPATPRRWRRAVAGGLAAAACLVTSVSVMEAVKEHQHMERADARARTVASVLSAPDAQSMTGRASGGGTVTMVVSATRGRAIVTTSNLRRLSPSKRYQLWLFDPDGSRSAGMLPHDRPRTIKWRPTDTLGVTVEPSDGSPHPTTPPVVILKPP